MKDNIFKNIEEFFNSIKTNKKFDEKHEEILESNNSITDDSFIDDIRLSSLGGCGNQNCYDQIQK